MRRAFVTGSAGFIGFHLCRRLLEDGWQVAGFDGMTDYYDTRLKRRRHAIAHATVSSCAMQVRNRPSISSSATDRMR